MNATPFEIVDVAFRLQKQHNNPGCPTDELKLVRDFIPAAAHLLWEAEQEGKRVSQEKQNALRAHVLSHINK